VNLLPGRYERENEMITKTGIQQAVARGWCTKENKSKEFDSVLAEAISDEIWQELIKIEDLIKECIEAIECGTEEPYTTQLSLKLMKIIGETPDFAVDLPDTILVPGNNK
jgi:hypothetical protein